MEEPNIPILTVAHRQARLNFAKANIHREWEEVIFSGKTKIEYCNILGSMTFEALGRIRVISNTYSSGEYVSALEKILEPLLGPEKMVFAQKGTKVNQSELCNSWLQPRVHVLNLPRRSDDLNPIVNVWRHLRENVKLAPRGNLNLEASIMRSWLLIRDDADYIIDLYQGMHSRIKKVVERDGGCIY